MVLLGRTLYSASASLFQKIYVCYSPARRSVLGKYCAWGLGCHPRPYARQRAQFLPIDTDQLRLVNNFFFLKQKKCFPKEPEWLRAVITTRSSRNGTIFEQVEGRENRGNTNQKEHFYLQLKHFYLHKNKRTLKYFFISICHDLTEEACAYFGKKRKAMVWRANKLKICSEFNNKQIILENSDTIWMKVLLINVTYNCKYPFLPDFY